MKHSHHRHFARSEAIHGLPRRLRLLAMTAILFAITFPCIASDFESRSVTPEYSGPSARTDSGGMGNTEPMVTRRTPIGPSSSDTGFDRRIEERGAKISNEMDRRREESIRIKEEQLLKTNE